MEIRNFDYIFSKLELNDIDLMNHLERTAMLSYALARDLDMYPEDLEIVYMAGLLHEIGKSSILDEFSIANSKLNYNEVYAERLYKIVTAGILNCVEGFEKVKDVILQLEENIDGSGYPKGLSGEQLSLNSIIVRISDFYDTHRAQGLTHDQTTKLLRENSDIIFPRKIITPFIKSILKNELQNEYSRNANN